MSCPHNVPECGLAVRGLGVPSSSMHGYARCAVLVTWHYTPRENFSIKLLRGLTGIAMTFIKLEELRSVYFVVGRELIIEVKELLAQVLVVQGILSLKELVCQCGIAVTIAC
jgi:hypothetical protein